MLAEPTGHATQRLDDAFIHCAAGQMHWLTLTLPSGAIKPAGQDTHDGVNAGPAAMLRYLLAGQTQPALLVVPQVELAPSGQAEHVEVNELNHRLGVQAHEDMPMEPHEDVEPTGQVEHPVLLM